MYHIGQQIDDFQVARYLGRGPLTEVYLAEHIHIHSLRIAIKVPLAHSPDTSTIHYNRYQALEALNHSHILGSRGYTPVNNSVPMLKMDYAPGGSLRDRIAAFNSPDPPFVMRCLMQIASALDYAHSKRIVHGNLKPQNILFDAQDNVLLSDFDAPVYPFQQSPPVLHALHYVAPEQLAGQTLPASDQYQLACIAYAWLTNQSPLTDGIPQARLTIPGMESSNEIERVMRKALARDYSWRYTTVQEFAEDLRTACGVSSVESSVNSSRSLSLKPSSIKHFSLPRRLIAVMLLILLIGSSFLVSTLIKLHASASVIPPIQEPLSPQALYASVMKSRPIFEDSLNGNDTSHWLIHKDRSGDGCIFTGGALHLVSTQPDDVRCFINDLDVTDFAFQIKMTILQPGGVEAGLLLHADQHTFATYLYFLDTFYYNSNFYIQNSIGATISRSDWYSAAFQRALQQPNVLTVIARKNTFYFYLNGAFVNTITDNRYPSGSLGVYFTEGSATRMDVAFNDAKVWT